MDTGRVQPTTAQLTATELRHDGNRRVELELPLKVVQTQLGPQTQCLYTLWLGQSKCPGTQTHRFPFGRGVPTLMEGAGATTVIAAQSKNRFNRGNRLLTVCRSANHAPQHETFATAVAQKRPTPRSLSQQIAQGHKPTNWGVSAQGHDGSCGLRLCMRQQRAAPQPQQPQRRLVSNAPRPIQPLRPQAIKRSQPWVRAHCSSSGCMGLRASSSPCSHTL